MNKFDEKVQLITVGESTVGKTSILFQYTQGIFQDKHLATVGIEYFTKDLEIDDKIIRVKIWDTAGQEQYKSLTKNFYRNSNGVVVVFDLTNPITFQNLDQWMSSIRDNADDSIKLVLIGNKNDLNPVVSSQVASEYAKKLGIEYFETSAKEGTNISEAFRNIIDKILKVDKDVKMSFNASEISTKEKDSTCKC